jgi:nucleoside-diphosphate-sugar epimerase
LLALAKADGLVGTVNVAAGEEVVLGDVAAELAVIAGAAETGLGRRADQPGDPERLVAALSPSLAATGWRPLVRLPEGLRATFDWWRREADRPL